MDIAAVTSVWGSYGSYLPQWADSLVTQMVLPSQVVIMDGGMNDRRGLEVAREILDYYDILNVVVEGPRSPMGAARNAAVEPTTSEWVMHLDADDVLLPNAIADVEELADDTDVACMGAVRNGQVVTFPQANRCQVLMGRQCCYSCAPFRRELWETRPWHTRNNWVDSTFWVGFAHLGARFKGTQRPGFIYRDHPDSFSHQLDHRDRRLAHHQWKEACKRWRLN